MLAAVQWLHGFATSTIVIGFLCVGCGMVLYAVTDIILALVARHS